MRLLSLALLLCVTTVAAAPGDPISAGPLQRPVVAFQFALYFLPAPEHDPKQLLAQWVEDNAPVFAIASDGPAPGTVYPDLITDVPGRYAVPDPDALRYFGRGLSPEQTRTVQGSQQALTLTFVLPAEARWRGMQEAVTLTHALAERSGALIWDEDTRELFSREYWHEARVQGWETVPPDLSRHFTVHAYQNGERIRAITLGLGKFGLPDMVVRDFDRARGQNVGHLINLAAQALAEGERVADDSSLRLDIGAIRHPAVRAELQAAKVKDAVGRARWPVIEAGADEGDPDNVLIELGFGRFAGSSLQERQHSGLTQLFGYDGRIYNAASDDAELLAASRRARARLPALRERFHTGLEPGDNLTVKAGFSTPDDSVEWMWVQVVRWDETGIHGTLLSEPRHIPSLRAGANVSVSEDDVFDYSLSLADGSAEGNETSEILLRRAGERE